MIMQNAGSRPKVGTHTLYDVLIYDRKSALSFETHLMISFKVPSSTVISRKDCANSVMELVPPRGETKKEVRPLALTLVRVAITHTPKEQVCQQ